MVAVVEVGLGMFGVEQGCLGLMTDETFYSEWRYIVLEPRY